MTGTADACCKVGAAIERFDLDETADMAESFDDRLVARWKGEGRNTAQGYRPLTEWFNKRLLKREYDRNGVAAGGTRLDREYEALTGDDDVRLEEVRGALRSDGVDVDAVERSFVSWSTMQRHLTGCLDAEKEPQRAETDWERNSVAVARDQLTAKVESAVRSLSSKGELEDGEDVDVSVTIELECPECPLRVSLDRAIDRGYVCEEHS